MDIMKEDVEHLLRDVREGKKLYECDRCDHRFTEKDNLKFHIAVVHKNKEPYPREICDKKFLKKKHMKRHIRSVHTEIMDEDIDKENQPSSLLLNYRSSKYSGLQKYKSAIDIKSTYNENEDVMKENIEKLKNNEDESTQFIHKTPKYSGLQKNNSTTHKVEKLAKCVLCNAEFEQKRAFKKHVSSVHGRKHPSKYDLYENFVKENIGQNQHKKSAHEENNTTHHCQICNKDFSDKHGLKIHIAIVHEEIKPLQWGPFPCNFCGSTFGVRSKLKLHIQGVHEGTKPFQCHLCDFKTFYVSSMNMHMRVHEASNIISTWDKI